MRMIIAAAVLAAAGAAAPAAATSLTVNHELIGTMAPDARLPRGRDSLPAGGLSRLQSSGNAAFAETGDYVVALYCIAAQGAIVVTAAGPEVSETDPIVTRVLQAWRDAGAAQPTK